MQMMSEFTKEIIERIKNASATDNETQVDDSSQTSSLTFNPTPIATITAGGALGVGAGQITTMNIGNVGYTNVMPGGGGGAGNYYISSGAGTGGTTWSNPYNNATVKITGNNPTISTEKNDINLDELAEMMKIMRERLLILIPDFEKQEKYIALKKAYDHYKLIEAMLKEDRKDD